MAELEVAEMEAVTPLLFPRLHLRREVVREPTNVAARTVSSRLERMATDEMATTMTHTEQKE